MTTPAVKTPANGVTPKPKAEIEVGVSNFLPFVVPYRNAWEALRDEQVTVRQLRAMRQCDGQARALYRLITLPIRAALKTATFVPASQMDGGQEEADFIEQMMTLPANVGGMQVSLSRFIAQLLTAIFDGFAPFEMVYWVPDVGPLKGKWTLKKCAARPAETITFLLDDQSEYAGMRQRTMYLGRSVDVTIPKEHSFWYAANEEERPFYGDSFFTAAFEHWDKKFKLYTIAHIAAQRAAVGTRVGTMPASPSRDEKQEFQKALADLGVAQWMTVPDGYKVESMREIAGFDFLSYINHHNSQMSKSVLAAFFDDQQGGGGDTSLVDFGRQSDALFLLMLQTIMGDIEEVINNKIIPRFIDWNFGSGKYPRFTFGQLTEEQKSAIVGIFKTLAVAGQSLTVRPEFVHELEKQVATEIGLEIDWQTVEEEMAQEKERADAMAQMAEQVQAVQLQQAMNPEPPVDPAAAGGSGGGSPTDGGGGNPHQGHPIVDPTLLPRGFTLSDTDDDEAGAGTYELSMTDYAHDLLVTALDNLELTRGKPTDGGPKVVRTGPGAQTYGVPVGTPITRDLERKAGTSGPQGAPFGAGHVRKPYTSKVRGQDLTKGGGSGDSRQGAKLPGGGGKGATSAQSGTQDMVPKRILVNPKQPGAQLMDFGDGTVAIRDANGVVSPRQRFNVETFLRFGWRVDSKVGDSHQARAVQRNKTGRSGRGKAKSNFKSGT